MKLTAYFFLIVAITSSNGFATPLIGLDPGHGIGAEVENAGATGPTGLKEHELNLDITNLLYDKIIYNNIGFFADVYRTRTTSEMHLTLERRARHANNDPDNLNPFNRRCDVFLSIHHNGGVSTANGTETFWRENILYPDTIDPIRNYGFATNIHR